jgi:hypothetical protein
VGATSLSLQVLSKKQLQATSQSDMQLLRMSDYRSGCSMPMLRMQQTNCSNARLSKSCLLTLYAACSCVA